VDARLTALFSRSNRGIKFDLERMRAMLRAAGNPERGIPTVLIAGTNGKGSLTAMWTRALSYDGHRVGTYTSPHLIHFGERIMVGGVPVDNESLAALFDALEHYERSVGITLTFFEAATFMAFLHFRTQNATALVLEVGMGGRLDATNACDASLCLITTIGMDHMEFLGDTEAAIAREKAGIHRPGVPLVTGVLSEEAKAAIAHLQPIALAPGLVVPGREVPEPKMFGAHQRHNAALFTLSTVVAEPTAVRVSVQAAQDGVLATVRGRFETLMSQGTQFIIDGAHNGPAMRALREALLAREGFDAPRVLVFGGTQGRALQETLLEIEALFTHVVVCEPPTERAIPLAQLQAALPRAVAARSVAEAITTARTLASNVCMTGSLYLVGEALALLGDHARDQVSDYR
jgi:dihydrofolate synthase/folylpolyglutamate synthase